jgi:peroxiredoxin
MNPRKTIIIAVAAFVNVVFFCGIQPQRGFTVRGEIKGLSNAYIYLNWQQGDSVKIDSALVKEGKFKFKGHVVDPSLAVIFLKKQRPVRFYLENADIEMTGSADSMARLSIKGSATQSEFETYNLRIEGIKNGDQMIKETISFIADHPRSYLSIDKLQEFSARIDYKTLNRLFGGLESSLKESIAGKRLEKQVVIYKNTSIGSMAPVFDQQDVNGKNISLADLRGKYVLLDFWASWCVPCRQENPNVLKAYNKYHEKGLTILAVSLDEKAENWKKAIEEDHMPWLHVSDLKGTENAAALQYGVFSIPSNFLIDPQGKIVAKDLRGASLEEKLEQLFKN